MKVLALITLILNAVLTLMFFLGGFIMGWMSGSTPWFPVVLYALFAIVPILSIITIASQVSRRKSGAG